MPQSAVEFGQQPIPNPTKAMPVTRAITIATPVSSVPNNNHETSDGTINNARPVAASPTAASVRIFFIKAVHRHSKGGDPLNHPESCNTADAVRRHAPTPCWLRYGRASTQRHDTQDRRDEEELPDFNASFGPVMWLPMTQASTDQLV